MNWASQTPPDKAKLNSEALLSPKLPSDDSHSYEDEKNIDISGYSSNDELDDEMPGKRHQNSPSSICSSTSTGGTSPTTTPSRKTRPSSSARISRRTRSLLWSRRGIWFMRWWTGRCGRCGIRGRTRVFRRSRRWWSKMRIATFLIWSRSIWSGVLRKSRSILMGKMGAEVAKKKMKVLLEGISNLRTISRVIK